jgi:ABC-type branched-subunit amino acid transport system ATPase component
MLAIARGLMSEPTVLLMDEPPWVLAPLMVQEIARTIRSLREEGATIVLVEQMASVALSSPIAPTCWKPAASRCRAAAASSPTIRR